MGGYHERGAEAGGALRGGVVRQHRRVVYNASNTRSVLFKEASRIYVVSLVHIHHETYTP